VKGILLLSRAHIAISLRERVTLFWFLVFPILLLSILALIFGNTGGEGNVRFDIALVNEDSGDGFSGMIERAFGEMATPAEGGGEGIFSLAIPRSGQDRGAFLEEEMERLSRGGLAAILVIPAGFNDDLIGALTGGERPAVDLYLNRNDPGSRMAGGIIDQVIAGVNREILIRSGRLDPEGEVETKAGWIGDGEERPGYIDFLLPGIVLMGFFTAGLFGVPGTILYSRDVKILRRYWVSPLTVPRYVAGFAIGHIGLCTLQFGAVYTIGRYAFGARLDFARVDVALVLLLSIATFMAFGFLIASIARTPNGGMAIANILNMPMMFLSGLFFPITGLPLFLLALVYVNPVSYLIDSLRAGLGVGTAVMPGSLRLAVPLGWIALSIAVAGMRLRWDVER